jgi:hypothetical protein
MDSREIDDVEVQDGKESSWGEAAAIFLISCLIVLLAGLISMVLRWKA